MIQILCRSLPAPVYFIIHYKLSHTCTSVFFLDGPCSVIWDNVFMACKDKLNVFNAHPWLSRLLPLQHIYLWADTPVALSHSAYIKRDDRVQMIQRFSDSVIQKATRCYLRRLNCVPAFPTDTWGTWQVRTTELLCLPLGVISVLSDIMALDISWYLTAKTPVTKP